MKNIYIIGAGGLALEVLFLIEEINKEQRQFNFGGFIDKTAGELNGFKVFDEDTFLTEFTEEETCVVFGLGDPALIKKIHLRYSHYHFPNLIHPNFIGDIKNIHLGRGNLITAGCVFTTNVKVGDFNLFNLNTTVGHDAQIGNINIINPSVNISGGVIIGNNNLIGVGSIILQYKTVGNDSIVGAASLVTKNVGDNVVVLGVPAKTISNTNVK